MDCASQKLKIISKMFNPETFLIIQIELHFWVSHYTI